MQDTNIVVDNETWRGDRKQRIETADTGELRSRVEEVDGGLLVIRAVDSAVFHRHNQQAEDNVHGAEAKASKCP